MIFTVGTLTRFSAAVLTWGASSVFAADPLPVHSHSGPCWNSMHWPVYWWIFPLAFFILMTAIWIYALRKGPRSWRSWCMPWVTSPEYDNTGQKFRSGSGDSARDVLDKRLAKGEIDTREYEELKNAIADHE